MVVPDANLTNGMELLHTGGGCLAGCELLQGIGQSTNVGCPTLHVMVQVLEQTSA